MKKILLLVCERVGGLLCLFELYHIIEQACEFKYALVLMKIPVLEIDCVLDFIKITVELHLFISNIEIHSAQDRIRSSVGEDVVNFIIVRRKSFITVQVFLR